MIESYVDLTYRGLPLGRRVKLAQVRPTSGYLEMPTPMPVGTTIAIATDDGLTLAARVTAIQEQVGSAAGMTGPVAAAGAGATAAATTTRSGATGITGLVRTPGMMVEPVLGDAAARAWWGARVALPEAERGEPGGHEVEPTDVGPPPVAPAAVAPATVAPAAVAAVAGEESTAVAPVPTAAPERPSARKARARTPPRGVAVRGDDTTAVGAPPPAPVEAAPPARPSRRRADLESELAAAAAVVEAAPVGVSSEASAPELVDDGKRTVVMDAITPEALAALLDDTKGDPKSDDGKRTQSMASVDLAALGLEPATDADGGDAEPDGAGESGPAEVGEKKLKTSGGSVKRRRKRR